MADATFTGPGFHVEPISVATGGRVQPGIAYEGLAEPTRGALAKPRESLEARYGRDLEFPGDFVVQPDGDLALTRSLEALRASFARAIITSPGELFWRASYGVGATEFLNQPNAASVVTQLRNRIRSSLIENEAVDEVVEPAVRFGLQGSLLEVETRVTVAGQSAPIGVRIRGGA